MGTLPALQTCCAMPLLFPGTGTGWFQREVGSVLTVLLLFLGIPARNPGLCSFVFYPLSLFIQLCLVGTSKQLTWFRQISHERKTNRQCPVCRNPQSTRTERGGWREFLLLSFHRCTWDASINDGRVVSTAQ